MAAYARLYGFRVYRHSELHGQEDNFTCIGGNHFMLNEEYEFLCELQEKEF